MIKGNMIIVSWLVLKTLFSQLKKPKNTNILLLIFWIKTQRELLVSCTSCLEHGQPIGTKLSLNRNSTSLTCWNIVILR